MFSRSASSLICKAWSKTEMDPADYTRLHPEGMVLWGEENFRPTADQLFAHRRERVYQSDTRKIASYCRLISACRQQGIDWRSTLRLVRALRTRTADLIDYLWPVIHRLAECVMQHGVIGQAEIEQIIG